MNERLKELRVVICLNQRDFSSKIQIGHSTVAMFETGQRSLKDIHIKTICSVFNVNETWLRTGTGEMFNENEQSIISDLTSEYNLDTLDKNIIETYLKLDTNHREAIKAYITNLFDSRTINF